MADTTIEQLPSLDLENLDLYNDYIIVQKPSNGGTFKIEASALLSAANLSGGGILSQAVEAGENVLTGTAANAAFIVVYARTNLLNWSESAYARYYTNQDSDDSYTNSEYFLYAQGAGDGSGSVRQSAVGIIPVITNNAGEKVIYINWSNLDTVRMTSYIL